MTFELNPSAEQDQLNEAARHPVDLNEAPGFFTGLGMAPINALESVAAKSARSVNLALSNVPIGMDAITGSTKAQDWWFDHMVGEKSGLAAMSAPDAQAGLAAQVLRGFVEVGGQALTLGPVGVGVNEGINSALQSVDQGVDAKTALAKGAIEGTALGFGVGLPMSLGLRTMDDLAYAATANALPQMASRLLVSKTLDEGGYHDMAQQYQWLDAQQIAVDTVLGVAFGGLGRFIESRGGLTRLKPSQVDAALAAFKSRHAEIDAAPGIPADPFSRDAQLASLVKATEDLIEGRPVDVSAQVDGARYVPDPDKAVHAQNMEAAIDVAGHNDAVQQARHAEQSNSIPRAGDLSPQERAVETRLAEKISNDFDGTAAEYAKLDGALGGKVLNTDLARELSPDYSASHSSRSTLSAAVHEPASWFVKQLYARKLAEPDPTGINQVTFTAGGTGAGKSTGIANVPEARFVAEQSQIIYDTNMNGRESSFQKIDQALDAGKTVQIVYVARDPIESLTHGALPRAMRMGRTVPLKEHLKTHQGAADTMRAVVERYAGNERVKVLVIDNSHGKDGARLADLSLLDRLNFDNIGARAQNALQKEFENGRINETVYRGTLGNDAGRANGSVQGDVAQGARRPDGQHVRPGTEQEREGGSRSGRESSQESGVSAEPSEPGSRAQSPATPEITAAADIAATKPDLQILLEDGSTVSAAELLTRADQEIAQASTDARAFGAAVACFLKG